MSYIALARKWRPRTFSQLIGQSHVSQALVHSLTEQRIHHAYIFTGTRGVGKTSIARLFAKALNCEKGISAEPCLQCDACIAIEQGSFLDLIEIDAASKTGVDDTRQMLENAQYLPTQGRFKIYLIDEVHMLSQSSFNALLKTLEEPPSHVKFFLATTDPQKIPVTVLSRCLQFSLRTISEQDIIDQLVHILTEESIYFEQKAIEIIAHAAQGSMRDGLSLLDQALAIGNQQVTLTSTQNMLGYTHQDYPLYLLQALADSNAKQLLKLSADIGLEGGNYSYVTEKLLQYLHQMIIHQQVGNVDGVAPLSNKLIKLANHWSPEDLQLFYQIILHGQDDLSLAPMPSIGFDVMMIRLLQFEPVPKQAKPDQTTIADNYSELANILPPQSEQQTSITNPLNTTPLDGVNEQEIPNFPEHQQEWMKSSPAMDNEKPLLESEQGPYVSGVAPAGEKSISSTDEYSQPSQTQSDCTRQTMKDKQDWSVIVNQLEVTGMAKTALDNTSLKAIDNNTVYLVTHGGHLSLFIPSVRERISEALSAYFNRPMTLHIDETSNVDNTPAQLKTMQQRENSKKAVEAIESDPVVQEIKENFSANVLENSITFRSDEL